MTAPKVFVQQSDCAQIWVYPSWIWDRVTGGIFVIKNFCPAGRNQGTREAQKQFLSTDNLDSGLFPI